MEKQLFFLATITVSQSLRHWSVPTAMRPFRRPGPQPNGAGHSLTVGDKGVWVHFILCHGVIQIELLNLMHGRYRDGYVGCPFLE